MLTGLDVTDYLDSLALDHGRVIERAATDGAALYQVGYQHAVVIECTEHRHPHGACALVQAVLPEDWVQFAFAHNPADGFAAHHWGPPGPHEPLPTPVPA